MNKTYNSEKATIFILSSWLVVYFALITLQWFFLMAFISIGLFLPLLLLFYKESRQNLVENFKEKPYLLLFTLPFFIQLYSVFYSENIQYWADTLGLRVQLVAVLLILSSIKFWNKKYLYKFFYAVLIISSLFALITDINLFLYSHLHTVRDINGELLTPTDHIIFTIALAISFFIGVYLYNLKEPIFTRFDKYILISLTALVFVSLHYIPVRSGLVGLYAGIFTLILQKLFTSKAYKIWIFALVLILITPFVSYLVVPQIHEKVNLTLKEVNEYNATGKANGSSDGNRLLSWKIAIDLWEKEPVLGIGAGDIKDQVYGVYEQKYPEVETKIIPHSMWLVMLLGGGIVAFILFGVWVFVPLIKLKLYKSTLYFPIWAVIFLAMLPNLTLQVNTGSSLVSIMLGLCTFVAIKLEQHKIN